jgi:CRISPR/Cas system-associated exonuclease Cas4 (RecB family)
MTAFLEKLTEHIYAAHKDSLGDMCIILPNRRASLFIKKHLERLIKKTTFLPEFFSIEDFVTKCSGLCITDPLGAQFKLYELHKKIEGDHARSIEEFLPYATWMLSDFNEIDMYMVKQEQLFNYLSDAKAMALWNPDGSELSDFEKHYLAFFRSLQKYYEGLNKILKSEKQAYQGMAFRLLAENIESLAKNWTWSKIIFAGFNALTNSEEKIISFLLAEGKSEIFWDADKYYTESKEQEAGYFLRKYFKTLKVEDIRWEEDNFSLPKTIEVIGVPKNTGQVKYTGELIQKQVEQKRSLDGTAVVLSDEGLLIPLLNSIPEEAGKFNVTMGLALKNTPLFTLLDNIMSMHLNAERFNKLRGDKGRRFYSKDLVKLFNHPYIRMCGSTDKNEQQEDISGMIRNANRVFFSKEELMEILGEDHLLRRKPGLIFSECPGPDSILKAAFTLIHALRDMMIRARKDSGHDFSIEMEYLFRFNKLLQRIQELMEKNHFIETLKTLQLIFRQLAAQQRIPFYGEPLQGLQVMGMLETRTLDFETVIMLSVNEGTLPSSKMPNSFIPYDMKREFGLPTYRHNNAVFAYHFYRLIQRAKDVYLLYNTESDQLGGGEKSQFITQLLHEVKKYNPEINISEKLLSLPPQPGIKEQKIIIEKDDTVLSLLNNEAETAFNPSSLNLYINCPLQFYFSRLLKIKEIEEAEETIDSKTLGIVVHEVLKTLYDDHKGKPVGKETLQDFIQKTKDEVNKQFDAQIHFGELHFGKNYLIVNVATEMLKQLFEREISWLKDGQELRIVSLEKDFRAKLQIKNENMDQAINFVGWIDRIDKKGSTTRILDYKTGYTKDKELKPKSWEDLFTNPDFNKAFQLIMYSWLYHKENPGIPAMQAGIISLRSPGNGPMLATPPESKEINETVLGEFEEHLSSLMIEIFDPSLPFRQAEDESRCKYCSFKEICIRAVSSDNY